MKTRDILLIAGAGALVYFATRRRTPARPAYRIDVPPPTRILREDYERMTRPRGAQLVEIGKGIADFLAKLRQQRQGAEPKGEPWYGQFKGVGKLKDFA